MSHHALFEYDDSKTINSWYFLYDSLFGLGFLKSQTKSLQAGYLFVGPVLLTMQLKFH